MARNKVLEKSKVSMPTGRNSFDLSQVRSATALAGELNVCYAQPMVAGTKGKISRKCFSRTADVVSPAFHKVTEHFDFFIVPLHALWRGWENWKLNINDMQDTNLVPWDSSNRRPDLALPANAPRMDFLNLVSRSGNYGGGSASAARRCNDIVKLAESLNHGEISGYAPGNISSSVQSLFMLGAYQKIYFSKYRNSSYESNNPYAYNFDWLYDGTHNGLLNPDGDQSTPVNLKDNTVVNYLTQIRRVNYRNDYFHNIYPALNYWQPSINNDPFGASWSIPSDIGQVLVNGRSSANSPVGTVAAIGVSNYTSDVLRGGAVNNGSVVGSSAVGVSVQSIRSAFALDRLMRASAYTPKHVKDQWKALYGVDGVEDFDMDCQRICSFQSDVMFQEVTNMAESSTASLGDLGAKGVGSNDDNETYDFYCKYDSIVMGIHYFLPRQRYDAFGVHPWNIKISRESFYVKAFENLGLRPFLLSYLNASYPAYMIGWTEANFDYKVLPDLNYGPFKRQFLEFTYSNGVVSGNSQQTSQLRSFVPHNHSFFSVNVGGNNVVTAEYFKVSPEDLDNIFKVAVPSDHRVSYFQFYGEFRIVCAIVAPMSIHSQPSI